MCVESRYVICEEPRYVICEEPRYVICEEPRYVICEEPRTYKSPYTLYPIPYTLYPIPIPSERRKQYPLDASGAAEAAQAERHTNNGEGEVKLDRPHMT